MQSYLLSLDKNNVNRQPSTECRARQTFRASNIRLLYVQYAAADNDTPSYSSWHCSVQVALRPPLVVTVHVPVNISTPPPRCWQTIKHRRRPNISPMTWAWLAETVVRTIYTVSQKKCINFEEVQFSL